MLSDEIAAARMCLRVALDSRNADDLRTVAEGVCNRLELLEADAVEWQGAAVVAPLARLPDGAAPGNVLRFRRRPG